MNLRDAAPEFEGAGNRRIAMNMEIFQKMPEDELRRYIAFLLWHYRVVDAFWFIKVAERFDQQTAERINASVWSKVSGMAAKDMVQRFQIERQGLEGFVQALRLFPWCILVDYRIEQREKDVLLSVPNCPTQEARIQRGLGEYDCKEMHRLEFLNFGRVIEPRLVVQCLFAPPDDHPANMMCQWRFSLAEKPHEERRQRRYYLGKRKAT
jgi:hypothetical protein